jgi:hypothetical protein
MEWILVITGIIMWAMYSRLDAKIEKSEIRVSTRMDSLSEKIDNIDRGLCRLEGIQKHR